MIMIIGVHHDGNKSLWSLVYSHRNMCIYMVLYTKILEVNSFAFANRLFHEDFSSSMERLKRNLHKTVSRQMQMN